VPPTGDEQRPAEARPATHCSTELGRGGDVPAEWAETLRLACAQVLTAEPDLAAALDLLADGTGVPTLALLSPGSRGGPVVRRLVGSAPGPEIVRTLVRATGCADGAGAVGAEPQHLLARRRRDTGGGHMEAPASPGRGRLATARSPTV